MVGTLYSGPSLTGGVVLLGKTLDSHAAPLQLGAYNGNG